jgi:hypothetical protein
MNNFHQNSRGLRNKREELIDSFVLDSINPRILCLSGRHMEEQDLLKLSLTGYSLGSSYCRRKPQKGGVCIFVRVDQSFNRIGTSLHCAEQTLETCATEFETKSSNLRILPCTKPPPQTLTNL